MATSKVGDSTISTSDDQLSLRNLDARRNLSILNLKPLPKIDEFSTVPRAVSY